MGAIPAFNGTTPYLAYSDSNANFQASMIKYDGSPWTLVGSSGFSPQGVGGGISLALG